MPRSKHKRHHIKLNPTQQALLAVLLLVGSALFARGTSLSGFESDMFYTIYHLPDWLYPPFYIVTQLGSIYVLGVLLLAYFAKEHYHIVIRLLMTGTLAYLLAGFIKGLWGRVRPHELLPDIITLDYFQGAGFPSGHVALATALAITLAHYFGRRFYWVAAAWIIGVALSRMYLGVHLPLDIVGGFAVGWFSYAIFRHVRLYDVRHKRISKAKDN